MNPQLEVSKEKWDEEFSSGRWDYLDSNLNERARHAVIGMYCRSVGESATVLDVGCGEGTLVDFLSDEHKKGYLGIDISEVAVSKARQKRRGWNFVVSTIEEFSPKNEFDIIVCDEMLYYVDFERIVPKVLEFLSPNGFFVTSLYRTKDKHFNEPIQRFLDVNLSRLESTKIVGDVKGEEVTWTISCHGRKGENTTIFRLGTEGEHAAQPG